VRRNNNKYHPISIQNRKKKKKRYLERNAINALSNTGSNNNDDIHPEKKHRVT